MKIAAKSITPAYYAAAIDYKYNADGSFEPQDEERQIYVWLFVKTLLVSGGVMSGLPVPGISRLPICWPTFPRGRRIC